MLQIFFKISELLRVLKFSIICNTLTKKKIAVSPNGGIITFQVLPASIRDFLHRGPAQPKPPSFRSSVRDIRLCRNPEFSSCNSFSNEFIFFSSIVEKGSLIRRGPGITGRDSILISDPAQISFMGNRSESKWPRADILPEVFPHPDRYVPGCQPLHQTRSQKENRISSRVLSDPLL